MLLTAAVAVGQAPPPVPIPSAPAESRWAPPPPLPSAAQPYRPLQPADAPPLAGRPAAPAPGGATRPVLTLQKPAGAEEPKPPIDPKPSAEPSKTDRDPPKAVESARGVTDKAKVFRLDSEADSLRRIVNELRTEQEARNRVPEPDRKEAPMPISDEFFRLPPVDPLTPPGTKYQAKTLAYPGARAVLEPGYVMHRRLYFEDLNSERYGWEVGIAQPALSTLLFYKDTFLYPAKLASNLGEWYDTSAGKCLPGSPVPYLLYPEPVDTFGLLVGAGAIVGVSAVLP